MGHHGREREDEVRSLAARLGVADFVYFAEPARKGAASREVAGDGLLVVGARGAILQVKARDPELALSDSPERAAAWVRKNAMKAAEQGVGTRRELVRRQRSGEALKVYPSRAARLAVELRERYALIVDEATDDWPVIVVIDHPNAPHVDLGFRPDTVWITFSDWRHLQQRLRSTSATLEYVARILQDEQHVLLGSERDRYVSMRAADEKFASEKPTSIPWLSHERHYDETGADIFHDVINHVWPHDGILPWHSASDYRAIVQFLDQIAPGSQAELGRWILRKRSEIARGAPLSSGVSVLEERDRLVFACSHLREYSREEEWLAEIALLGQLRHIQALESGAPQDSVTLAVGVLVENRAGRSGVLYTYALSRGLAAVQEIPRDLRAMFEERFGIHDHEKALATRAADRGVSDHFGPA